MCAECQAANQTCRRFGFTISVGEGLIIPEEGKHLNNFNQIVGIKGQTSKAFFFSAQYVSKFKTHKILVVDMKC